jgi:hypothetical protein
MNGSDLDSFDSSLDNWTPEEMEELLKNIAPEPQPTPIPQPPELGHISESPPAPIRRDTVAAIADALNVAGGFSADQRERVVQVVEAIRGEQMDAVHQRLVHLAGVKAAIEAEEMRLTSILRD